MPDTIMMSLSSMHPSVSGIPCVITSITDIITRYTIDTGINNSEYITITVYMTTVRNNPKIDMPELIVLPDNTCRLCTPAYILYIVAPDAFAKASPLSCPRTVLIM